MERRTFIAVLAALLLLPAIAQSEERMTMEQFNEIVSQPGDNIPLIPQLAATEPLWTNATVEITSFYRFSKSGTMKGVQTAKTVQGKYIVTTTTIGNPRGPEHTILTYDEKESVYRLWSIFVFPKEDRVVYDTRKKTFAINPELATNLNRFHFTWIGFGNYSNTQIWSHMQFFDEGVLESACDIRVTPATTSK